MTRPYTRHRDHAAMAGPATRATTDAILARLHDEESDYASMLHEEIPDWVDIVRRPTPRPTPLPKRLTPAPTQQEESMPRPRPDLSLTHADRARVKSCLKKAGVTAHRVAVTLPGRPNLSRWLDKGSGLSAARLADLFAWCEQVEAGTWVAPIDGRKVKKVAVTAVNPEPYPEVRRRSHDEILAALAPEPEPDPAAHVLETWAAQKLAYAMETLGLVLPEGYRFRVTVERAAAE